jgi:hypothetical protein
MVICGNATNKDTTILKLYTPSLNLDFFFLKKQRELLLKIKDTPAKHKSCFGGNQKQHRFKTILLIQTPIP